MLKMKNISSEMKQSLDRTKSISDTEEEKISEVEDRLIKIFQSKAKKQKAKRKLTEPQWLKKSKKFNKLQAGQTKRKPYQDTI